VRSLTTACALVVATWLASCSALGRLPKPTTALATREWTTTITLHNSAVELHLAMPAAAAGKPADVLVLYASGDGGWFGAAVGMFHTIAANGYPTVGISSKTLLKMEREKTAPLHPQQLALDYASILEQARRQLGVAPETPAILSGWSRGAAFAVLAAAAMPSRTDAAGIVAIGLAEGEDLRIDGRDDETDEDVAGASFAASAAKLPFAPYDTLVRTVTVPSAVIQATGDNYLPAARARSLFGPDTQTRRFWEIPGRNHRFDGAGRAFVDAMGEALRWVSSR
jgi:pimeloyl-ACP methyl ester carboxylesterase